MSDITTQIAVLETKMEQIANKVDEGFRANTEEHKEIMKAFEKAIEKKAGKWVEKVLLGAGATIGMALLGALLRLVII